MKGRFLDGLGLDGCRCCFFFPGREMGFVILWSPGMSFLLKWIPRYGWPASGGWDYEEFGERGRKLVIKSFVPCLTSS